MRVFNFSAGPAMLPEPVLAQAQAELLDWRGSGMSVMEVSHRGKEFVACAAEAEASLRELMGIPDGYKVLFLQGGAYGQFSAIPLNLAAEGAPVDFLSTGDWTAKAISEAKKYVTPRVLVDEKPGNYTKAPAQGSFQVGADAAYLHYTPNETIRGVEFGYVPDAGDVPLVADLSSTILSRPVDVSRFGLIFAGAQKNMGPSGMCVVIVRDDLLNRARPNTPAVWNYAEMAANDSMLNTPPTFGWYLLGLVYKWVLEQGGLTAMGERNQAKAEALVRKAEVRNEVRSQGAITDRQIIEANAARIADIQGGQKATAARIHRFGLTLLAELETQTVKVEDLEKLGELLRSEDENGRDQMNDLYRKIISTPGRVDSGKKVAETLKHAIGLERQAYGLDKQRDDDPPGEITITF